MADKDIINKPEKKVTSMKKGNLKKPLSDIQKRTIIIDGLSGRWEYYCEVAENMSFENGEVERGGVLIITQKWSEVVGMNGKINGYRQWSKKKRGNRTLLIHPTHWETESSIDINPDIDTFNFSYTIIGNGQEGGKSRDVYEIDPNNGFKVSLGTFKHTTVNGNNIHGSVHLRKMNNPKDYFWAPKTIKPLSF